MAVMNPLCDNSLADLSNLRWIVPLPWPVPMPICSLLFRFQTQVYLDDVLIGILSWGNGNFHLPSQMLTVKDSSRCFFRVGPRGSPRSIQVISG